MSEREAANISLTTPWITNPPLSFSSTSDLNPSECLSIDCLDTAMYYSSAFGAGIPPLLAYLSSQWKACRGGLSGWGTASQAGWEAVKPPATHTACHVHPENGRCQFGANGKQTGRNRPVNIISTYNLAQLSVTAGAYRLYGPVSVVELAGPPVGKVVYCIINPPRFGDLSGLV